MKIILEPTVEVVGHTKFIGSETFEIPDDGDDFVKLGSFSGKVCYDSNGKNGRPNADNQLAIMEHRHGSVLEHSTVSMYITGITRGLTLELNRHRTFNISQRSTRYTAEEDSAFVLDPYYAYLWKKHHLVWDDHKRAAFRDKSVSGIKLTSTDMSEIILVRDHVATLSHAAKEYERQVELLTSLNPEGLEGFELRKWARGKARNVLPHGLETRGVWTNNMRGWRWFIELRSERHAEPEIRRLADVCLRKLKEIAPLYFNDFEPLEVNQGIVEWKPRYSKV